MTCCAEVIEERPILTILEDGGTIEFREDVSPLVIAEGGPQGPPGTSPDLSEYATLDDLSLGLTGKADSTHFHAPSSVIGGAANSVACFNASGVLVSYSGVTVDQTNARLGFGLSPAYTIDATSAANAISGYRVATSSSGNAAQAVYLTGNGSDQANYGMTGIGFTPFGVIGSRCAYLYGSGPGGLALMADNVSGTISFATGGNAQAALIDASGRTVFGTGGASGRVHVRTTAALTGLVVQGAASQVSPLTVWWNSASSELARVTAAGNFLIGNTVSTNPIHVTRSQNANTIAQIENANAGTAAQAIFATSNGTDSSNYGTTGTGYSGYGVLPARCAYLYSTRGLCFVSDFSSGFFRWAGAAGSQVLELTIGGKFQFNSTVTPAGTVGNRTINLASGTVNIAAGGTTVRVTNSLITATSLLNPQLRTNDATAWIRSYVCGSGFADIYLGSPATGEVSVGFLVVN